LSDPPASTMPHSAFHDATARATQPRHSIEFRTIAYFEKLLGRRSVI